MSYSSTVLALSPIAYWRLGEPSGTSAADASGNGHGGTYVGSPTLGVAGLLTGDSDTAVTLGSGKYVSTPTSAAYNVAHPAVVAWISGSSFGAFQMVASQADGTTANHWFLCFDTSGHVIFTVTSGGDHTATSSNTVGDNARHMVVGRYDGSFIDVFVDGVRVAHVSYAGGMNTGTGIPVTIGAESTGTFTGTVTVDEVAYFDAANLTDAAISSLWAVGTGANSTAGSLTLAGTVSAVAKPGASGSLTLGGTVVRPTPASANGSLTLGSPSATPTPVYLASFTVDPAMELSDIPLLPADTPTVDYVGDDDSDLVTYPDPVLDEWGRPIAS